MGRGGPWMRKVWRSRCHWLSLIVKRKLVRFRKTKRRKFCLLTTTDWSWQTVETCVTVSNPSLSSQTRRSRVLRCSAIHLRNVLWLFLSCVLAGSNYLFFFFFFTFSLKRFVLAMKDTRMYIYLCEYGLHIRRVAGVSMLTRVNQQKCLKWAHEHQIWISGRK